MSKKVEKKGEFKSYAEKFKAVASELLGKGEEFIIGCEPCGSKFKQSRLNIKDMNWTCPACGSKRTIRI